MAGIADDIFLCGKTEAEHDRHMHQMIETCQVTWLKLNPDKSRQKKFYVGNGIQHDPAKVSALRKMTPLSRVQEV